MTKTLTTYNFYLNCTKEVFLIFFYAKILTYLFRNTFITFFHLICSLILNFNLFKIILKTKEFLQILHFYIKNNFKKFKDIKFLKHIVFSKNVIKFLNNLNQKFINTWNLTYNLLANQNKLFKYILIYIFKLNYNTYNLVFRTIKTSYILNKHKDNWILQFSNIIKPVDIKYFYSNIINIKSYNTYIYEILTRKLTRNLVLLGDYGVGKVSIIKKFITFIQTSKKTIDNKHQKFLLLNIVTFLQEIKKKENTNLILTFFKVLKTHSAIILICPNIHIFFNLYFNDNITNNLELYFILNKFFTYLKQNKFQLIGFSNKISDIDKKFTLNYELNFLFERIYISEPSDRESFHILLKKALIFEKYYNCSISFELLKSIFYYSKIYIKQYKLPIKSLWLLDASCSKLCHKEKYNLFKTNKTLQLSDIQTSLMKLVNLPSNILFSETNRKTFDLSLLKKNLHKSLFGQSLAISKILISLKRVVTGLKQPNKPIGSWLLSGPSGTGKTELAKLLAKFLFGSETDLIRFDMSEYMEKHSLSKLIGAPPGYLGYGKSGLLTEAIAKKPFAVLLFDEIEKAHRDITNLMLQLLDDGKLTDSLGNCIDFSNTLILFTSNLGFPNNVSNLTFLKSGENISKAEHKLLLNRVEFAIKNYFKPEFLNRLDDIIVFKPLNINFLKYIINKFLKNISLKLYNNKIPILLDISINIKILLVKLAYHPLYGARPLKRLLELIIEKPISDLLLNFSFKEVIIFSIFLNKEKSTISYSLKPLKNYK